MNWWKEAQLIQDFSDRNLVNHSIDKLEKVSDTIMYCSELIYQTNRGAKKVITQIANSKFMSTYPDVIDVLHKAALIALDSPKKFADLCKVAAQYLKNQAEDLALEREKFISEDNPQRMKGWIDEQR